MRKDHIDMLIEIGGSSPEKPLILELARACFDYLEKSNEDNKQSVMALCLMVMSKYAAEQHKDGLDGLMAHLEQRQNFEKLLDPNRHEG